MVASSTCSIPEPEAHVVVWSFFGVFMAMGPAVKHSNQDRDSHRNSSFGVNFPLCLLLTLCGVPIPCTAATRHCGLTQQKKIINCHGTTESIPQSACCSQLEPKP